MVLIYRGITPIDTETADKLVLNGASRTLRARAVMRNYRKPKLYKAYVSSPEDIWVISSDSLPMKES